MGTVSFNSFSDGYIYICIVGEFNEIPRRKIGDKDHYGPGVPVKRLAGVDDLPNIFCAVSVLACTWLLKICVA